jgi:hypothetical protein
MVFRPVRRRLRRLVSAEPSVLALAITFSIAIVFAVVPISVRAQAPQIRTELDTALVAVGDRMNFTVRIEHDPSAVVAWPDSLALGSVEVLGAEFLPPASEDGRAITVARFSLTAFALGDLEIPSFDVEVQAQDGSSTTLSTNPYLITVQSVGLDEGGDIRAIRGPLGIPLGVIYVLPWILLGVLLCALGYWLWVRRKPVEAGAPRSVVIPRLPHEEANDALDRLEASGVLERGEIKEYHIIASEIIRTYVEGRFRVHALEMTTGEVVEGLQASDISEEEVRTFERFALDCDLVKFAKLRPLPDACRDALVAAREFVEQTRPRVVHFAEGVDSSDTDVDGADGAGPTPPDAEGGLVSVSPPADTDRALVSGRTHADAEAG